MAYTPPSYYDANAVYDAMDDATLAVEDTFSQKTTARNTTGETAGAFQHLSFLFTEMQAYWMTLGSIAGQDILISNRFNQDVADYVLNNAIPESRWGPTTNGGRTLFTQLKTWAQNKVSGGQTELQSVAILAEVGERTAQQLDGEAGTDNSTWTSDTLALLATLPAH